jgi:UDP-N-acetylglucosamine--N-acetylmuramyl-(pentapeptide) pyrophosphoryl-undecaprenol N-acetylglucosamine transferase
MKILITGAHFTPAIAVIEELKKYPDIKITYVGRRNTLEGDNTKSMESQILPSLGIKFIPIITGRLQRSFSFYTIFSLLKLPVGVTQAFFIILMQRPDVVLSFGGYVAVPIIIWAWLFSIPIIIHEQTLVSGLANSFSSLFASKIAYSFKIKEVQDRNIIFTGNPIREEIQKTMQLSSEYIKIFNNAKKNKIPVIFFTAGNQGSHIINLLVEKSQKDLNKIANIILITGDNKFKDFERINALNISPENFLVKKWIDKEYGSILRKVDLVVCRAGANTLTELAYLGKPALTIPIPYLYKNEQNINAKFFKDLGLVEILSQSKLSKESLLENIELMFKNLPDLKERAKRAKSIVDLNASKRLALETILLGKKVN